jgi:hypothetical protein
VPRYIDIEDSERLLRAIQLTVRNATTALEQAMQRAAA